MLAYHSVSFRNDMDNRLVFYNFHCSSMLCHSYQTVADRNVASLNSYLIHSSFWHSIVVRPFVHSITAAGYNSCTNRVALDSERKYHWILHFNFKKDRHGKAHQVAYLHDTVETFDCPCIQIVEQIVVVALANFHYSVHCLNLEQMN